VPAKYGRSANRKLHGQFFIRCVGKAPGQCRAQVADQRDGIGESLLAIVSLELFAAVESMAPGLCGLFVAGVAVGYAVVLPVALRFLLGFGEGTFDEFPPPMVESRSSNYLTIALEEVASGKLKYHYR